MVQQVPGKFLVCGHMTKHLKLQNLLHAHSFGLDSTHIADNVERFHCFTCNEHLAQGYTLLRSCHFHEVNVEETMHSPER